MIAVPPTAPSETPGPPKKKLVMGPDNFMDQFIKKREPTLVTSVSATQVINPLEEFDQYFSWPCVDQAVCTDLIAWWGVSQFFILCLPFLIHLQHQVLEYPVMCLIACEYAAIPGLSCLAEWAFSLSARTDSACCGNMEKKKFGGLQRL